MTETDRGEKQKAIVVSMITLAVALFGPVGLILIDNPSGAFAANLIGTFWTIFLGTPIPIDGGGMIPPTVDPTAGTSMVLLLALRLLFVLLLYRVYNNQNSKRFAIYCGVLSELFLIIINIPSYISSITTFSIAELYVPLPILLLVGGVLVWKFPPFVPSTPWEKPTDVSESSTTSISR